ncbi:hypothetical protein ACFLVF_01140 [Chloroflexota bacterium]
MFKTGRTATEENTIQKAVKSLQNKPQQATKLFKGLVIGQDWRVGTDTLNIILYRRHINYKTGNEYWRPHSYYATATNAMEGLINQGIRDTELADLKTVCDKIDQLRRDILIVCGAKA